MSPEVNVVILAAGLGTRMRSNKAKVLHQAGGDTLLNQIIRAALQVAPAERIITVVGHQADEVRRSVQVSGIRFAEQAVYEDELTLSPLNSLDGLLGNAAVTKQPGLPSRTLPHYLRQHSLEGVVAAPEMVVKRRRGMKRD